jgi:hypothetical protein
MQGLNEDGVWNVLHLLRLSMHDNVIGVLGAIRDVSRAAGNLARWANRLRIRLRYRHVLVISGYAVHFDFILRPEASLSQIYNCPNWTSTS